MAAVQSDTVESRASGRRWRLRPHTKIAIGFALGVAGLYYGYNLWAAYAIDQKKFNPIEPDRVALIAVDPKLGYRIVVANQIATLVESGNNEFHSPDQGGDADADSGGEKRRLPIRELLRSLIGDEKALTAFVSKVNDINEDSLPATADRVIWTAADLKTALETPGALRTKLEKDLNVTVDGQPLPVVRRRSLMAGIVVELPVPIRVPVASGAKTLTANVQRAFRPNFCEKVEERFKDRVDVTDTMISGYYGEEARKVFSGDRPPENIKRNLGAMISDAKAKELAERPERLLSNVDVVLNGKLVESANYNGYKTSDNKQLYDLTLNLSGEGRDRLWKYSRGKTGFQLLFTVDGIAIAAPRISHELNQRQVTINQLPDESLVRDAVDLINRSSH